MTPSNTPHAIHTQPLNIGIVLFDRATLTDFSGPWDVFKRLPNATTFLIAHDLEPMTASGMPVAPTMTWDQLAQDGISLDVICVPGGGGHISAMADDILLGHLRRHAETAAYVTAVCTGSLILAAAGLLDGYRATTHWMSLDRLEQFGAIVDPARVVIDRSRVTGGGVTAAIDFALTLAAELRGEDVAKSIQLGIEYAPAPPFTDGHPDTASAETIETVKAQYTNGSYTEKMADADARALEALKNKT